MNTHKTREAGRIVEHVPMARPRVQGGAIKQGPGMITPEESSPTYRSKWSTAENRREKSSSWPCGLPHYELAVQRAPSAAVPEIYCGLVAVSVTEADCTEKYGSDALSGCAFGRFAQRSLRAMSTKGVTIKPFIVR